MYTRQGLPRVELDEWVRYGTHKKMTPEAGVKKKIPSLSSSTGFCLDARGLGGGGWPIITFAAGLAGETHVQAYSTAQKRKSKSQFSLFPGDDHRTSKTLCLAAPSCAVFGPRIEVFAIYFLAKRGEVKHSRRLPTNSPTQRAPGRRRFWIYYVMPSRPVMAVGSQCVWQHDAMCMWHAVDCWVLCQEAGVEGIYWATGPVPGDYVPEGVLSLLPLIIASRNSGQAESGVEGAEGRDRVPGCFRYPGGNRMNTGEVDERRI